jgi:hypothetical protein
MDADPGPGRDSPPISGADPARDSPGYMERAVQRDIDGLADGATRGRAALVALALTMARVLDREAAEVGVTAMAKAADSLRTIMDALTRPRGDESNDLLADLLDRMSTPARDEAHT